MEPVFPDAVRIVHDGIAAGVLFHGAANLNDYDDEPETIPDNDGHYSLHDPLPVITLDSAIHYVTELSNYLQALKVIELYTPGGKELSVKFVKNLVVEAPQLQTALAQ